MPILKPATLSPGAPRQYKQHSRKGKKAWRKNVDVSDIQEGLEVVRDEVIKGYKLPSIGRQAIIITYNIGA
jgi:nucleolar protein 53